MKSIHRRRFLQGVGIASLAAATSGFARASRSPAAGANTLSGKLAFAHYMTAGIRSFDNAPTPDYYDRGYLDPNGENGTHAAFGGYSRNRPTYRPPISAPAGSTWTIEDARFEVASARQAGLDGFAVLIPNYQGVHIQRMDDMWEGAQREDPTFLMRMMPDMGGSIGAASLDDFVGAILRYGARPNTMRLADGRLVISPYRAELKSVDWWQSVVDACASNGAPVALVPIMVNYTTKFYAMAAVHAVGVWGSRSPATTNPQASAQLQYAAAAHAAGKLWVQNVALQDVRPIHEVYDEAVGSSTLVNTTQLAVNTNADWADLETWNDPAEHTGFYPSRNFGTLALELWRRHSAVWSTGAAWTPDDSVFLMHRPHFAADTPSFSGYTRDSSGAITTLMALRPGSTPPVDIIEISSWFTAPTTVLLLGEGVIVSSYTASAGYFRAQFPLMEGAIAVIASRDGSELTLLSPTDVTHAPYMQDLTYWGAYGYLGRGQAV